MCLAKVPFGRPGRGSSKMYRSEYRRKATAAALAHKCALTSKPEGGRQIASVRPYLFSCPPGLAGRHLAVGVLSTRACTTLPAQA